MSDCRQSLRRTDDVVRCQRKGVSGLSPNSHFAGFAYGIVIDPQFEISLSSRLSECAVSKPCS